MSDHPITPSSDLVRQWNEEALSIPDPLGWSKYIATQAARWGADQELEACCDHIRDYQWGFVDRPDGTKMHRAVDLQLARRPKPPSLAEDALEALEVEDDSMPLRSLKRAQRFALIRAALERLQELESAQ